ncbi:hypothetical protein IVA80_29560 [Bradyrhizobium sp. 139]|uniref:hypothetical protein n=1 Tax=Bradyrhizobium sp. 139 TaxID=2782616 RepID=UPI001FF8682A|nr:hypothetical protein [Bradyrhizobium sp. 139]MCK1744849.1 hypothetical protein [Bradyrhizobium sp. 139]
MIVIKPCRAFSRRCLVDCLAVRPGSIANPNRLLRHASCPMRRNSWQSRTAWSGEQTQRRRAGLRQQLEVSRARLHTRQLL